MRTSWVALAVVVGGAAGIAIVASDDWLTKFAGFAIGCMAALGICLFLSCAVSIARCRSRKSHNGPVHSWDDYTDRAYKIERTFMDDGKPW